MTTENNPAPTETGENDGIQQIPAVVKIREAPGVNTAREQLLQAIGQEAQQVTQAQPGNASAALEQLARAYALATSPITPPTPPADVPGATPLQGRNAQYDNLRYVFEYEYNPE